MLDMLLGDNREILPRLSENCYDACVTDPPYELGFMGKKWDSTGIAYDADWWRQVYRVLKPGAHLLAFGGSRTSHRIACAIEDAGFDISDTIMWIYGSGFPKSHNLTGEWDGWGTALKPAHEPVIVARKPFPGTVAANVSAWGTGALNIDGYRIKTAEALSFSTSLVAQATWKKTGTGEENQHGRWPANILLDEQGGAALDAQSGYSCSTDRPRNNKSSSGQHGIYHQRDTVVSGGHTEHGGVSRFFYCAKASRGERNAGCAVNHHPTVKPLSLMRYLCRLVTPPGGVVLDPFLGSGSTACAAMLEGFGCVGIEREGEYLQIALARVAHWQRVADAEPDRDQLTLSEATHE